jgi:hypothetical protein
MANPNLCFVRVRTSCPLLGEPSKSAAHGDEGRSQLSELKGIENVNTQIGDVSDVACYQCHAMDFNSCRQKAVYNRQWAVGGGSIRRTVGCQSRYQHLPLLQQLSLINY